MARRNLKYLFRVVFEPLLDFVLSQLDKRFAGHDKIAISLCTLVPHYFGRTTFEGVKPPLLFSKKILIGNILYSVDDYGTKFELLRGK